MVSRSLGEVARLQAVVDGYQLSMASDSVVSGIVASLGHRKILLEVREIWLPPDFLIFV